MFRQLIDSIYELFFLPVEDQLNESIKRAIRDYRPIQRENIVYGYIDERVLERLEEMCRMGERRDCRC